VNYSIHDLELLAIVESTQHWKSVLESCEDPFVVISDHQSLQHFRTSRPLTPRLVRWSQDLNAFSYSIKYRPARFNSAADTLS
ncbi:uncharacterized protein MKK02DRAFT_8295, partial [Dioszegia hungarica]